MCEWLQSLHVWLCAAPLVIAQQQARAARPPPLCPPACPLIPLAAAAQAHKTSALEYALQTWVIPVSIIVSLVGIWASVYHLLTRWVASGESKGCWGCNAI